MTWLAGFEMSTPVENIAAVITRARFRKQLTPASASSEPLTANS